MQPDHIVLVHNIKSLRVVRECRLAESLRVLGVLLLIGGQFFGITDPHFTHIQDERETRRCPPHLGHETLI